MATVGHKWTPESKADHGHTANNFVTSVQVLSLPPLIPMSRFAGS